MLVAFQTFDYRWRHLYNLQSADVTIQIAPLGVINVLACRFIEIRDQDTATVPMANGGDKMGK